MILRSSRLYLWPAIVANVLAMSSLVEAQMSKSLLLSLALCALASFGFLVNDVHDRRIDRVNRANRLETASSRVLGLAKIAAISGLVLGILLAAAIGSSAFLFAASVALGLASYTLFFRARLVVGTVLAATLSATPLWGPFLLFSGSPEPTHFILLVGVWLILFGREIVLDLKDVGGDSIGGRKTIPTEIGPRRSILAAASSTALGGILLFTWGGTIPSVPLIGVIALVAIILAIGFVRLLTSPDSALASTVAGVASWSRVAMLLLAAALLVAGAKT